MSMVTAKRFTLWEPIETISKAYFVASPCTSASRTLKKQEAVRPSQKRNKHPFPRAEFEAELERGQRVWRMAQKSGRQVLWVGSKDIQNSDLIWWRWYFYSLYTYVLPDSQNPINLKINLFVKKMWKKCKNKKATQKKSKSKCKNK